MSLTLSGGGASAENMWGPLGGPGWVAHDPSKNAAKLKGVAVYAAASAGGEGDVDRLPPGLPNFTGGLIEGIVAGSTKRFVDAATAAGVPVNDVVRPEGSHTWGLFESEMDRVMEHHHRPGAGGIATTDIGPAAPCGHRFSMAVAWALLSKPRHR